MTSTTLTAAAFGGDPGRWPLPAAKSPDELWLRAVVAGGQGHYCSARADLAVLRRRQPSGPLASLALSTEASFLRQLGRHRFARGWDGRALALAPPGEATVDALVGLAADALGIGRLAASARLLGRAAEALEDSTAPPPRLAIRLEWVGAELAMAGSQGEAALQHARRGVELAATALPELTPRCGGTGSRATWCWRPRCAARATRTARGRLPMPPWPTRRPMVLCHCGGRWRVY